jgi:acetylornithine deacetylase/succinyl-diaminopimelate desuccinylase-like protein
MIRPKTLAAYAASMKKEFERTLAEWVAIPTVSAIREHSPDVRKGARTAVDYLKGLGATARAVPTPGNPVVIGTFETGPSNPTVTIYNHLDVQPADEPEWKTDPFAMTIRSGTYTGRGTTDDKGPALTALLAARFAAGNGVPLNIRLLWELEEEIGSPNFEAFVRKHRSGLRTDSIVVSDTVWLSRSRPAIPYGLRGMLTARITLETGTRDVHSGLTGGGARNPVTELAGLAAECVDSKTGKVLIPGFYDDMDPVAPEEIDEFVRSGFTARAFARAHGLRKLRSMDAHELTRRIWTEPTFEVHGLVGGYQGPGVKSAIAPRAELKVSMRLVPGQSPRTIFELLRKFVRQRCPDARVEFDGGLPPFLGPRHGPYADAAREAMKAAFGRKPASVREGGSIGAIVTMDTLLAAPIVFLGLSLPEHGYHAPNEHYDWGQASGGIQMFVRYFEAIARMSR